MTIGSFPSNPIQAENGLLHLCETQSLATAATEARPFGGTKFSWCKAVPVGTSITVLGLLLSKPPQIPLLQKALHALQTSHPILHCKFHHDPSNNTFHFLTPPTPTVQIHPFNLPSTTQILQAQAQDQDNLFHALLHYQMSSDTWRSPSESYDVLYASTYSIASNLFARGSDSRGEDEQVVLDARD
ncbi:hypothetical protein Fmac_026759 [Flemingia macrophylla]|uniref:Uncharacterized protein n=1 Tax=Flemingia macrophylla TaxID=520843 RepID=A0ABD1LFS6_9FABA